MASEPTPRWVLWAIGTVGGLVLATWLFASNDEASAGRVATNIGRAALMLFLLVGGWAATKRR